MKFVQKQGFHEHVLEAEMDTKTMTNEWKKISKLKTEDLIEDDDGKKVL